MGQQKTLAAGHGVAAQVQHADRGRTVALGGDLRDPRIAVEKHQQRRPPCESGGHVQSAHIELFTPSRRSLFRAPHQTESLPHFTGIRIQFSSNKNTAPRRYSAGERR
jgi:hypothetical protein